MVPRVGDGDPSFPVHPDIIMMKDMLGYGFGYCFFGIKCWYSLKGQYSSI